MWLAEPEMLLQSTNGLVLKLVVGLATFNRPHCHESEQAVFAPGELMEERDLNCPVSPHDIAVHQRRGIGKHWVRQQIRGFDPNGAAYQPRRGPLLSKGKEFIFTLGREHDDGDGTPTDHSSDSPAPSPTLFRDSRIELCAARIGSRSSQARVVRNGSCVFSISAKWSS